MREADESATPMGTSGGAAGPLVSIVMPNLNKGRYIASAIRSALSQTYNNLELIVVDNGSNDESIPIIEDFGAKDSRITLAREPRRGVSYAINKGISMARGELITVMGSDDLVDRTYIDKQADCFRGGNSSSLCYTEGWIVNGRGEPTGRLYNRDWVTLPKKHEGMIFSELIRKVFVIGATVMYPRKCFDNASFDTALTFGEDWDFLVRLSRSFEFRYIPEPLYGYRIYQGNMISEENRRLIRENYVRIFYRWLRDFRDLDGDDRYYILKRLLRTQQELRGTVGMLQVALRHPDASIILLEMAKSSISHRAKRIANQVV